tara:strand:- start:140080 stop:140361 length:282 start_codon:yes stop_codon:yes gene_type:complete
MNINDVLGQALTVPGFFGTLGSACVILAYYLNVMEKAGTFSYRYTLLNLCGALMLTFSLVYHPNLPSLVIEMFWIYISVTGLYKTWRKKKITA